MWQLPSLEQRHVNVNVNNLVAISIQDFDNSGEPGPQAKGVNHLETPVLAFTLAEECASANVEGVRGRGSGMLHAMT